MGAAYLGQGNAALQRDVSQEGQAECYAGHGNAAIHIQVFQPSECLQCNDLRISNCSKSRGQQQQLS